METLNGELIGKDIKPKSKPIENHMIPKHRFDCVNLCLKETKQTLKEKTLEVEKSKARIAELESALLNAKAETLLAQHRAKDLIAAKALLDFTNMTPENDDILPNLTAQIIKIKESRSFLFENEENVSYVLVPVKGDEPFNKSIANYLKRAGDQKQ